MSRTTSKSSTTSSGNTEQKIGIYRYLQLYPQPAFVRDSLIKKYKNKVMTVTEWKKEIDNLLGANLRMGGAK